MAVDTNVIVRFVMRDDERQWRAAAGVFERTPVLIMTSVIMETEWVLRKVYGLSRPRILEGLEKLCGAEGIALESDTVVPAALSDYAEGWNLADAIHVRQAEAMKADGFATFDARLRRRAERQQSALPIIAP